MASTYAITSSNGGTWTIQSADNATVGRYHDLSFLMEGSTGANQLTTSRPGVLAASASSSSIPYALLPIPSGSGLVVNVYLGAAVVERTSLAGTYLVQSRGTASVTLAAADTTNPRIDRIDLQVFDGALGDNNGTSLTQVVVTTGTPAGTPTVPAAPLNSIPLATVNLPANTTTVTTGMVTDTRRSAGLRGAVRVLLAGDQLSDPGYMAGELRDTSAIQTPGTLDRWNATSGAWETLDVLGVGQGGASYISTDSSTLTVNSTHVVTFATAQRSCPDITASGTGNTTFQINRAGWWTIDYGWGVGLTAALTGGDIQAYLKLVASGTVIHESRCAEYNGPFTQLGSGSRQRYFNVGDQVQLSITLPSGIVGGGTIAMQQNGERIHITFTYGHA